MKTVIIMFCVMLILLMLSIFFSYVKKRKIKNKKPRKEKCPICGKIVPEESRTCPGCYLKSEKSSSVKTKPIQLSIAKPMNKTEKAKSLQKRRLSFKFKMSAAIFVFITLFLYMMNGGYLGIFPIVPLNPKTTTLRCNYAGKNIYVDLTLYGNINNYYRLHDYSNREKYLKDEDLGKFVYVNPKDKTLKELASKIWTASYENKLTGNGDQKLELATCLVQNIYYDTDKSNQITKGSGNSADTEQLPYQTLYLNKGVCTDKTYLGSELLKEMGYATGIFVFDKDEHVSLGVSVPDGYTSFNSKYAIMELTNIGFAPGSIPASVVQGKPNPKIDNINPISEDDDPSKISLNENKEISPPNKVIDMNTGKSYVKIKVVQDTEKSILDSISSLNSKKANLNTAKGNISYWNNTQAQRYSQYLALPATTQTCYPVFSSYPTFTSRQNCYTTVNFSKNIAYSSYTTALSSYNNAVSHYNSLVNDYNRTLDTINASIDRWKSYQYN